MSTQNFKDKIAKIRKEAIELGYSPNTMKKYLNIWNHFMEWKNTDNFIYDENEYSMFLLEYYHFDIKTYSNRSKSRYQEYMRSKRILDDFDTYKKRKTKELLPNAKFKVYPNEWNTILNNYLTYLEEVRCNSTKTIKNHQHYLSRIFSYLYSKGIINLKDINKDIIIQFINNSIDSGKDSKRRYFYSLKIFLNYLFIEDILNVDLSIYIPKIKKTSKVKIPTILKTKDIDKLLQSIPTITKVGIRDYAIILIAARTGLRIHDILNIKLKDIDWSHNQFKVLQTKTNHVNILPLSKEVGWSIIHYIKNSRPKCNNEYLFVKYKYPYKKMEQFTQYYTYFEKIDIEVNHSKIHGIHCLRHSLATTMIENEIPVHIIADTLGNSTEIVSKTYLSLDKKKLKECALELDYE